jgi:hypothetical protein
MIGPQYCEYWTILMIRSNKNGEKPIMFDFLKIIAVVSALVYLNTKAKSHMSTGNYWTMNTGLSLLLFAATLDFTDGIKALNHVPIIGQRASFHDILEDQFGDIPGFALFAFGALRELVSRDETPAAA